jgi:serine/threonine protein kinase
LLQTGLASSAELDSEKTVIPDQIPIPESGTRIKYFGDYELLQEIAQGGMGIVWKARQTSLKRDVALKMIRAGALASKEEVDRFLREAQAAANLQHPNIVAIHEVGEQGGQHYFTMDYVEGRDLGAIVKAGGPLPQPTAARYVKIIAEAIQFAHQRGILHRDLKPQNVIIDSADQPRITDFGLAKMMKEESHVTQTGVVMGSPSYMSPEQASGRHGDVGPASDVYSMGAMLYELLTGKPPFHGPTALATMIEVMEKEPTALRRLRAEISPDLETVCMKCLEKLPSARYPTAKALAEELDRYLKGEPILAKPASIVRKTVSWARRHPGILSAVAALVVVVLAFGVFYLFEEISYLRAQKEPQPRGWVFPGPHLKSLELWRISAVWATIIGLILYLAVGSRSRGLSGFKLFDKSFYNRPQQPLSAWARTIAVGASLIEMGCGLMLLITAIRAHVWEGGHWTNPEIVTSSPEGRHWTNLDIGTSLPWIFSSVYVGITTLRLVIRDYRFVQYGISNESTHQLTTEQIESIRFSLADYDLTSAIKRYREIVPDARQAEAKRRVMRIFYSLRAENPGRFLPPPLSLATLRWRNLLLVALIEVILLGLLWFMAPPAHLASAALQFAFSLLCGMLIVLGWQVGLRVKGVRKWLVHLGFAITFLSLWVAASSETSSSFQMGPIMCGYFCGCFLMAAAFKLWR